MIFLIRFVVFSVAHESESKKKHMHQGLSAKLIETASQKQKSKEVVRSFGPILKETTVLHESDINPRFQKVFSKDRFTYFQTKLIGQILTAIKTVCNTFKGLC